MSSLNQLISEIAHSVQQPNSVPVRRAIRQAIIHARNELIRQTFANHNYVDKVLKQKFKLSIIEVPDGDIKVPTDDIDSMAIYPSIKRTTNKVPRPVRLDNNLPFHSVKTVGYLGGKQIPYITEGATRFYKHLPGMSCTPSYDYINDYIYIIGLDASIENIIVESVFEYPHMITLETSDNGEYLANIDDNDEFFIPEDLINSVKKLTLETFNPQVIRETNEIPLNNLIK